MGCVGGDCGEDYLGLLVVGTEVRWRRSGFIPDWTDHWASGAVAAAAVGAAPVTAFGVPFVSEGAFEIGFAGDDGESGADMVVC